MKPAHDVPLALRTSMEVGGPAAWFAEAHSEGELRQALAWARSRSMPTHILGGGTNVIIADRGVPGLTICTCFAGIEVTQDGGRLQYHVAAGERWDDVVTRAVESDLQGIECLSGIPGLTGATPVQNVGAYGQDVSAVIQRIAVVDRLTGECTTLSNRECGFGYRTSRLKREADRFVVTRVVLSLSPGAPPTLTYADLVQHFANLSQSAPSLAAVRAAVLSVRRRKGMVLDEQSPVKRSCGSFFVNPVLSREQFIRVQQSVTDDVPHYPGHDGIKVPAAWLVERAGFPRGLTRGSVGVSPFQAQAIVNLGGAEAADVLALAIDIKHAVHRAFGVVLTPEPVFVGFSAHELAPLLATSQF